MGPLARGAWPTSSFRVCGSSVGGRGRWGREGVSAPSSTGACLLKLTAGMVKYTVWCVNGGAPCPNARTAPSMNWSQANTDFPQDRRPLAPGRCRRRLHQLPQLPGQAIGTSGPRQHPTPIGTRSGVWLSATRRASGPRAHRVALGPRAIPRQGIRFLGSVQAWGRSVRRLAGHWPSERVDDRRDRGGDSIAKGGA